MKKKLLIGGLSALGVAGSMVVAPSNDLEAPTRRDDLDHMGHYSFLVEVDGIQVGVFDRISGLSSEVDVIEFQDGDDLILRKRPGRSNCGNVTLEKGFLASHELWNWWSNVKSGKLDQRSVAIIVNDKFGNPMREFRLEGSWPCKWRFGDLVGSEATNLTEEITLAAENLYCEEYSKPIPADESLLHSPSLEEVNPIPLRKKK